MALKEALCGEDALFEAYSDAIYAQETFELDAVYRQAIHDVVNMLSMHGAIARLAE